MGDQFEDLWFDKGKPKAAENLTDAQHANEILKNIGRISTQIFEDSVLGSTAPHPLHAPSSQSIQQARNRILTNKQQYRNLRSKHDRNRN